LIRPLLGLAAPALALALCAPPPAAGQTLPPNELGRVMILEYHRIDVPENRWTRTPDNLRRDLETLYRRGYRPIRLNDFLDGRIATKGGKTPVILTFDDSSPGQFRYLDRGGAPVIDPDCAVGILEAFAERHPDFGLAATFFVLPGASKPNRLFNQPEHEARKLQHLVARGFEIGNHTLWHANLGKYPEPIVRTQIARAQEWITRSVPDYRIRALALPHGILPRDIGWALSGKLNGTTYRHDAILAVAGGPAPSPFASAFDPHRLPRIQAVGRDLDRWLAHFDQDSGTRLVSDGNPTIITIPKGRRDKLRSTLPAGLKVIETD
jgi:peptidoglycan/xylan/chitin deacetylase (PgdA/CDA1 family)